jgi:2,3-bisphosphoglycerate-independent phosphoglycerate mutase
VLLRGAGLHPGLGDTDPQREGLKPLEPKAMVREAEGTAAVVRKFLEQARNLLASESPANMILLRGFDSPPSLPQFADVFKLKASAVAVYPMYRGLAALVGMNVVSFEGERVADEVAAVERVWKDSDFIFMHVKKTDSYGEDGNREGKTRVIEEFDAQVPRLLALKPDVFLVTGDHSTPAALKAHSWHPSPLLLHASTCRFDGHARFTEMNCARGGIGRIAAVDLMPLVLAHALRLDKFGA